MPGLVACHDFQCMPQPERQKENTKPKQKKPNLCTYTVICNDLVQCMPQPERERERERVSERHRKREREEMWVDGEVYDMV